MDGTLLKGKETLLEKPIREWLNEAKSDLLLHLLSNNPSKKRISAVASQLELPYTYSAAKPRKAALQRVLNELNQDPNKVGMIGDRIFTDVLVGNRLGLYTVLVKPMINEDKLLNSLYIQNLEKRITRLFKYKEP